MNRITKKEIESYDEFVISLGYEYCFGEADDAMYRKLKSLEDIEEELGCPLEVVFKALKNRQVIFKHIVGLENPKITLKAHKIAGLLFDGKNYGLWIYENGYGDEFYVYTKDYKNTWWLKEDLTKEELENE